MNKGIIKFSCSALIVTLFVIVIDVLIGRIMDWMLPQTGNKGDLSLTNLGVNVVETPIVIVGSSRASHHYDSRIFADSLGIDAYNVGIDGCFFTHNCCVINSIMERYSPELIIWEFDPSYIYEHPDDISSMYPYYGKKDYITQTLDELLPLSENIKLKSNLYRYNSKFIRIITRFIQNDNVPDEYCGYKPSMPKKLKEPLRLKTVEYHSESIDSTKLCRLKETIKTVNDRGIKIVLVYSPKYTNDSNTYQKETVKIICQEYNVVFLDCSSLYLDHSEYFNDPAHLNFIGADIYTKHVTSLIKHMYYL